MPVKLSNDPLIAVDYTMAINMRCPLNIDENNTVESIDRLYYELILISNSLGTEIVMEEVISKAIENGQNEGINTIKIGGRTIHFDTKVSHSSQYENHYIHDFCY